MSKRTFEKNETVNMDDVLYGIDRETFMTGKRYYRIIVSFDNYVNVIKSRLPHTRLGEDWLQVELPTGKKMLEFHADVDNSKVIILLKDDYEA